LSTYDDYKQAAVGYQQHWTLLKAGPLAGWLSTPRHFNAFTADVGERPLNKE
jgi:hypothetical protein